MTNRKLTLIICSKFFIGGFGNEHRIVGLGLIGGSMAKSLSSRTAHTVFGIDITPRR